MIAIDTNVLVRLLTADSLEQHEISLNMFSSEEIFIADTVILETEWVLRAVYGLNPNELSNTLRTVFGLPNVHLDDPQMVAQIVQWHEEGLDFADGFHLALSGRCDVLKTFDVQFAKGARHLSSRRVEKA